MIQYEISNGIGEELENVSIPNKELMDRFDEMLQKIEVL